MTVRFLRIISLLAVAVLAIASQTSSAGISGPTGLHGFMLRADETPTSDFHSTPSFAWNPTPGALRYEFQLSISSTFQDNGILYDNPQLLTPVEAPPLTLPWITGEPHALYARVRAFLAGNAATPWSSSFGFDVTPPSPPSPLPSYPGLLRWTPVEGAGSYEVWLIDANKFEQVRTNVLDEREFYTLHQTQKWAGTVRWRIRAIRDDVHNYRINGIPAVQYGAWSPIYSSSNPALATGQIKLVGTVSDVFSDGSAASQAHRLMPAFVWTGNQTFSGTAAELYRVYVFTDSQCLNTVYTSAVVGSPAYAARPFGPLSLPQSADALAAARSEYLGDGTEAGGVSYDGSAITPTEQTAAATPQVTIPGDVPSATGTTPPPAPTGGPAPSAGGPSSGGSGSSNIAVGGKVGAPVDLWDTDWPQSGYYWTVVPVAPVVVGAAGTTVSSPGASKGSTVVPVVDSSQFKVGVTVTVGSGLVSDTSTITAVGGSSITIAAPLQFGHAIGEQVVVIGSAVVYQDLELPQDVCKGDATHPPRIQRFGIASEPSLTTAQVPFATGLSVTGRLTSAAKNPTFYSQPLVAWTPALAADLYQVQWSKTRYPFVPQPDPRTNSLGILTFATSSVLPLQPGSYWYRVRGFDYNLPTGVQQMSWSDPQPLVVSKPRFKLTAAPAKKFKIAGGSK